MVGVGDQADYDIDLGDFGIESLIVVDIKLLRLAYISHSRLWKELH